MPQEQSVLSKVKILFAVEKILLQYSVIGCRVDAYFPDHKLLVEVNEKEHKGRNINYEINRQEAIEERKIAHILGFIQER